MIKFAKRGTLHDKQLAAAIVREQGALMKLFNVLGPRYAECVFPLTFVTVSQAHGRLHARAADRRATEG